MQFVLIGDSEPPAHLAESLALRIVLIDRFELIQSTVGRLAATSVLHPSPKTVFIPNFRVAAHQHEAVRVLDECNACYVGCRVGPLAYRPQDVIMMSVYSEVPMCSFAVLDSTRPKSLEDLAKLQCPVRLTPLLMGGEWDCSSGAVVGSVEEAKETAIKLFEESIFVSAFEHRELNDKESLLHVVVAAHGRDQHTLVPPSAGTLSEAQHALLQKYATSIAVNVLNHSGVCRASFSCLGDGTLLLQCVALGQGLLEALSCEPLRPLLVADAERHCRKQHKNYVVTFDAATKGYHLRASRSIAKGEVVFEDERRSFVIITKDHVRRTWNDEDKIVFTRYAWPLDGDGHVYAIWDDEPSKWRPINHSCDPTCIYNEPYSLNVIAARDIAEGDDLTLDYASFCDFTMKPFQCHCNTSCCRGLIQPDEVSLQKYGKNSWHRKQPPMEGL